MVKQEGDLIDAGEEQAQDNNALDFFEHAGIDIRGLKGKYIRLNVGKMKLEGKVLSINETFGMLKVKSKDGYTSYVRLGKVSMLSVRD